MLLNQLISNGYGNRDHWVILTLNTSVYTVVVDSDTHGNMRTRRISQAQIWRLHCEEHD
jgi:hypothetical protein